MPKKSIPQMPMSARPQTVQPIQFASADMFLTAAAGIVPEHLLDPKYWALCANKLRPNFLVHVVSEDQTWYARVLVLTATPGGARVAILDNVDLTSATVSPELGADGEDYRVEYVNPSVRWRVVRNSDKVEVGRNMSKSAAYALVEERALVDAR